jgi:diguanylate cyclase (GGDEF)-like protein
MPQRLDPMHTDNPFNILLVDDDPTTIRILSHILKDFGPARFATSGHLAIKLARESVPDLVLLDIEMPDLNGFEVCKTFKSDPALAHVPIIFITSHESPQLEARGLQLGASDFIGKPLHAPILMARVRMYQHLKTLSDTLTNTLRNAVTMDFLTGTANRRALERSLTQECLRTQCSASPPALLLASIDAFAAYNGEFGEEMGDACLRSVAGALRAPPGETTELLARYSGSTFALLLPGTRGGDAGLCAQRGMDAVHDLNILASTGTGHITLSVGVGVDNLKRSSEWDAPPLYGSPLLDCGLATPQAPIAAAEEALRLARAAGGHQVRLAGIAKAAAAR